jgi:hypothetical protein
MFSKISGVLRLWPDKDRLMWYGCWFYEQTTRSQVLSAWRAESKGNRLNRL